MSLSDPKIFDMFRVEESQETKEVQDFSLGEFEAPPKVSADDAEKGEFRLLVYKGRQEDPLRRAQRQAKESLKKARADVEAAGAEADAIRQKAYDEGYSQGQQEGQEAAGARVGAALMDFERTLGQLGQARAQALEGLEEEVIALVQACTQRVLLTPGVIPRELVQTLAGAAISNLTSVEKVTVRVSPGDLSLVEEYRPQLLKDISDIKRLHLVADESLSPGDCLVESSTAQVDATLETRKKRIFDVLEETLRQGPALDWQALAKEQTQLETPAQSAPPEDAPAEPDPDKGGEADPELW